MYSRIINTLNESSLHKKLKTIYSLNSEYQTEVTIDKWICDIASNSGNIIEIQTSNLSKLLPKANFFLKQGKKFTIVYPFIAIKYIELYDLNGCIKYRRKSPKTQTIYDSFKELTGIYSILLNQNFILELLAISITEIRQETENPTQSQNNRRRHLKTWIKKDKILNKILKTYRFNSVKNYISLIPENTDLEFSAKTLAQIISDNNSSGSKNKINVYPLLWIFRKIDLIVYSKTQNRCHFYKINKKKLLPIKE